MTGFQDRRVVITGAGGGVGSALTSAFSDLGAYVVACDIEGVDLTSPDIAEAHHFDQRDEGEIANAAEAITSQGAPSVVVLNAGRSRVETLEQTTPEGIIEELNMNLAGAALLTHALLPGMRELSGDRAFVFVASVNAFAHHGNPVYSAAKSGLLAWMRAIAVEEGAYGIRANAVAPGSILTNAWDHRLKANPDLLSQVNALYPLGRIVTTTEVAAAVTFLASAAASGITGVTLNVDAGLTAGNLPFLDTIR